MFGIKNIQKSKNTTHAHFLDFLNEDEIVNYKTIENQRRDWFIANLEDIESLKDFVSVEYMEDDYETMVLFNSIIDNMRSALEDDEFVNEVLKLKTTTNFKIFVRTFIDLKSEKNLGTKEDKPYTIIIKDIILEYLKKLESYKVIKVDKYFVDLKYYNKVTRNESGPEVGTLVVKPAKNDWTVYGLRNCPYSKYAIDLLKALDERYNNIVVSDNEQSKSIVLKNLKKITEEDVPYDMEKIEKILKKGDPKLLEIQKRVKRMIKNSEPDSDSDEYEIDEQGNIFIKKASSSRKNIVINNSNKELIKRLFGDDSDSDDSDDENNDDKNRYQEIDHDDVNSDDENSDDENSDDENSEQGIDYDDVNSDDDVDQADNDDMSEMSDIYDDDYSPVNKQNQNEELPVDKDELKGYLHDYLSTIDRQTVTIKDVFNQLKSRFNVDFKPYKSIIKEIISNVLNELDEQQKEYEEEEEEEEEEDILPIPRNVIKRYLYNYFQTIDLEKVNSKEVIEHLERHFNVKLKHFEETLEKIMFQVIGKMYEDNLLEKEEEEEEDDDLFFIETAEGIIQPLEKYMRVVPEDWNTFPIIFLNERFIGGCDDLVKFIKNNILKMEFEGTVEELINYINKNRKQFENKVTEVKLVDFEVFQSEGDIPLVIGDFKEVEDVVHKQERCKYVYKKDYPRIGISKGDTCNELADKTGYGYCKKHNPFTTYTDISMGEIVKDTNITTEKEIITSTYIPRELRIISKDLMKEELLKDEIFIDEEYIDEVEESIYNTLFDEVEFETDDGSEVRVRMIDNPVLTYLEKLTDLTVYLGLKETSTYFRSRFLKKYYSLDVIPKLTSKDKYYDLSLLNKQKRDKILNNIKLSKRNQKQNIISRTLNLININNNKLYKGRLVKLINFDIDIDIKSIERPECYYEYENKENIYIYDGLCFDIKDLINKFSTNDFMYEKDEENKRFSDIFIEIVKNISLPQYVLQEPIIKRDIMKERVERLREKIFEKLTKLENINLENVNLIEFSPMKSSSYISNKSSISSSRSSSSYKGDSVVSSKESTDNNNKDICYYCKKEVIDNKYKTFKKEGDEYIVISFCSTECFEDSDEWNLSTTDDKDGTIDIVIEDRNDEYSDDEDGDDKTNTSKNSDSISIPTDIVSNKQKEMEEDLYNKLISD